MSNTKLLVIGIDALDHDTLQELLKKNKLPNFKKLIEKGSYGSLDQEKQTKSPAIWTSIFTGVRPEKHGADFFVNNEFKNNFLKRIFGKNKDYKDNFPTELQWPINSLLRKLLRKKYSKLMKKIISFLEKNNLIKRKLVSSLDIKAERIWETLSNNNISCSVLGHWATWPVKEINGFMVSDLFSIERKEGLDNSWKFTEKIEENTLYPKNLLPKKRVIRLKKINKKILKNIFKFKPKEIKEIIETSILNNFLRFKGLFSTDLFFVNLLFDKKISKSQFITIYIKGIDCSGHHFIQYKHSKDFPELKKQDIKLWADIIDKYYVLVDRWIGEISKKYKDYDLIILSDHGFNYWGKRGLIGEDYSGHLIPEYVKKGVIICYGKSFKKIKNQFNINYIEVAPTILSLFGIAPSKNIEGKIRKDLIKNKIELKETSFIPKKRCYKKIFSIIRQ